VGALEHVACIGLEHDSFAGAEAAHVHELGEVAGQLTSPVVLVGLRLEIDLALRAPQRS
jgi:hypothetical protein